jgi:isopenicillin N synthase-like dioxygenase
MRWSNDVYVSTPHRVLPPARTRRSIAQFLDPNPDALVSALPSCVPAGTQPRHAPVTAEAHLQERFDVSTHVRAGARVGRAPSWWRAITFSMAQPKMSAALPSRSSDSNVYSASAACRFVA